MLEEGVGDHRHERMTVEALPGAALEVVEYKALFGESPSETLARGRCAVRSRGTQYRQHEAGDCDGAALGARRRLTEAGDVTA